MTAVALALHTEIPHPEYVSRRYSGGTYRHITGVGNGEDTIWLPDADRGRSIQEVFLVPPRMPEATMHYFDTHYLGQPGQYRNCHIGAVAMTTGQSVGYDEALTAATEIVRHGQALDEYDLPVGAHGVLGARYDDGLLRAAHSLVAVAPGLAIQTDELNGPFSLVSVPHAADRYQNYHRDRGGLVAFRSDDLLTLFGPSNGK